MTSKYKQPGNIIDLTLAAAVTQGAIVVDEDRAGIALDTGVTGDTIAVAYSDVFTVPKTAASGESWARGEKIYSTPAGSASSTATGNVSLGFAAGTAATGDTTADVALHAF